MPRPSYFSKRNIDISKIKQNKVKIEQLKSEKKAKKKIRKNIIEKDKRKENKKEIKRINKEIKNLNKEEKKLINFIIKTANKNWITDTKLNKAGIPLELHDPIRIMSEKIHGKNIVFIEKPMKTISVIVKGSIIIISGVTAMQIPRVLAEYKKNKALLERHNVEYSLSEFLNKDLKQYKVSIEIPSNVFSKQSWGEYIKGPGMAFAGGALISAATIATLSFLIKKKINQFKAKRVLKKKGILP